MLLYIAATSKLETLITYIFFSQGSPKDEMKWKIENEIMV